MPLVRIYFHFMHRNGIKTGVLAVTCYKHGSNPGWWSQTAWRSDNPI